MATTGIKNRQPDPLVQRVHRSFADFEDLQECARHWDLDFRQMDRGRFDGEIHLVMMPEVQLGHVRLERRIEQAGAPPLGLRTIGVPADPGQRIFWRGRQVHGGQVLVYPLGSEIDAISQPGFDVYVLSFAPELLNAAAERLGVAHFERLLDASDVVDVDPLALDALRVSLKAWFPNPGRAWARSELPSAVVQLLARATQPQKPVLLMDRAIHMAQLHVDSRPFAALHVTDLCRHIGVSERTLRHSFRDRLGMTPKAYVRDRRLNLVRKALRDTAAPVAKIADIANRCDFWHMGQFAADYRRLFGELPSETLRRG